MICCFSIRTRPWPTVILVSSKGVRGRYRSGSGSGSGGVCSRIANTGQTLACLARRNAVFHLDIGTDHLRTAVGACPIVADVATALTAVAAPVAVLCPAVPAVFITDATLIRIMVAAIPTAGRVVTSSLPTAARLAVAVVAVCTIRVAALNRVRLVLHARTVCHFAVSCVTGKGR